MSNDRKIYKPRPVTGFPEWLPEVRLVEQQWFDHIRKVFESYGFCSIETPSVEELDVLRAKGEVDKEIYVLERLHKDENDKSDARLALHFDQTVPLARYVAQNFNDLVFPFKRYQIQRVWRGERPQAGRFREFYQCDIDVIGVDNLPLHFDAEMPAIIWEILTALPGMRGEKIQMRINNRKILIGYLESIGIQDATLATLVIREIDKLEKNGLDFTKVKIESVINNYIEEHASTKDTILSAKHYTTAVSHYLDLCAIKYRNSTEFNEALINNKYFDTAHTLLSQGIEELGFVLDQLRHLPENSIIADLSIVRGLDYYTGTVYETVFLDDPGYGSICSGGRYDDLAGSYISKHLPGVGISIGFSRLFARMHEKKKLPAGQKSPAHVMVIMPSEERRAEAAKLSQELRARGLNVEMYHAAKKIPDQMKYASRKGIPFVWFLPSEEKNFHEVKDMNAQTQTQADPKTWTPPDRKALDEVA